LNNLLTYLIYSAFRPVAMPFSRNVKKFQVISFSPEYLSISNTTT